MHPGSDIRKKGVKQTVQGSESNRKHVFLKIQDLWPFWKASPRPYFLKRGWKAELVFVTSNF